MPDVYDAVASVPPAVWMRIGIALSAIYCVVVAVLLVTRRVERAMSPPPRAAGLRSARTHVVTPFRGRAGVPDLHQLRARFARVAGESRHAAHSAREVKPDLWLVNGRGNDCA